MTEVQNNAEQAGTNAVPPNPISRAMPDPRLKSPVLAMLLSLMPGLGQVYIGYYKRGFIHILIVASVISFLASVVDTHPLIPLGGLFLAFFWMYNIVDAGRRASLYNNALHGEEAIEPPADFKMPGPGGSLVGGLCLIALGAILLSNTLLGISLEWVEHWWPVALFIPGVWLVANSFKEMGKRSTRAR